MVCCVTSGSNSNDSNFYVWPNTLKITSTYGISWVLTSLPHQTTEAGEALINVLEK